MLLDDAKTKVAEFSYRDLVLEMTGSPARQIVVYFIVYLAVLLAVLYFINIDIGTAIAPITFFFAWMVVSIFLHKRVVKSHERAITRTQTDNP